MFRRVGWSSRTDSIPVSSCRPFLMERENAELIERLTHELTLDLSQCYAYGDSPGDLDVFRAVGHPTVVNPIRGMASIARQQNWPVVKWR